MKASVLERISHRRDRPKHPGAMMWKEENRTRGRRECEQQNSCPVGESVEGNGRQECECVSRRERYVLLF